MRPITTSAIAAACMLASLTEPASAFWRMSCPGRLVLERADPIVSPGEVASHVHTVSGGNGFGFTMDYAQARTSTCSSCPIKQDLSNYWVPNLYYMSPDGQSFEEVPQAGAGDGITGGMTVYYQQRGAPADQLLAFPKDFRMLAGDPWQRNFTDAVAAPGQAVSFMCLDYAGTSTQTNSMPNTNCPDGLRAQVYFPSCWDGVNVDSPDHTSHMSYPMGVHYDNGLCPESHPKQTISIFYEVIYQTNLFADRWHSGDNHPFVFANGDRTGYGFHGDFLNGWDISALQTAVNDCTNLSGLVSDCPVFDDLFTIEECHACMIPPSVDEKVVGNLTALPGCNPPTNGPEYAPPSGNCPKTSIGQPTTYFTDVTKSLSWQYVGCTNDSVALRTFQGQSTSSTSMTVATCINYCKAAGYSLAGLEYASQCYCDNTYHGGNDDDRTPNPSILGNCLQPCSGDAGEICGGAAALSVYGACRGGACGNALFEAPGNALYKAPGNATSTAAGNATSKAKQRRGHLHSHQRRAALHDRSEQGSA